MPVPALVAVIARGIALAGAVTIGAIVACLPPSSPPSAPPTTRDVDGRMARVSLGVMPSAVLTATGPWVLADRDERAVARGDSGTSITVTPAAGGLRVTVGGQPARVAVPSPVSLVPATGDALVSVNGRRYRGALSVAVTDSAVQVINRLPLELYLRGVVPREIGVRRENERAAVEAQAVAARSYAFVRLGNASRAFDLVATTGDQVYGGVAAEHPLADAAIAATSGLVMYYGDRVISAPYSSTCGGTTAEPVEIWRSRGEPYLTRVSDRIPGTDRHYCDIAPRFRWERSWRADSLAAVVERYVRSYTQAPAGPLGAVRGITVDGRTPSGRVAAIRIETERGTYRVQGNDVRYVLRSAGGELLNSTYFSPEVVSTPDGRLARLTIRGQGYGHGVGMCQWGAIGRSRAGQDFRTILHTYFPGARVARAY